MGFFSKLAFWKKKDDLDIGKDLGIDKDLGLDISQGPSPDLGMGIETQQPFQKYPSFQQQSFQPAFQQPVYQQPSFPNDMTSKNLEVISSKLDALRASLESINQRLANIEAIARGEQEDQRRRRYY
jgi:hypothetical protein